MLEISFCHAGVAAMRLSFPAVVVDRDMQLSISQKWGICMH